MKKSIVTGIVALVVIGFGASAPAVASPQSQLEESKISVSYADLNIQNAAGAKALYSRLQRAAESVCDVKSYYEFGSLPAASRLTKARQCYADALDKAVVRIDSDALTKIHAS